MASPSIRTDLRGASFQAPVETLLTANEKFNYVTSMSVVGHIDHCAWFHRAVPMIGDSLQLIGVGLLAMAPPTFLGLWAARRHRLLRRPVVLTLGMLGTMIRRGLPFGFIALSLTISFTVDSVMLSRFEPSEVVGWYNAAYQLARSLLFFFDGISVAMVPTLRAHFSDVALVQRWYYRSVKVIIMMGLPIAIGSTLIALPLFMFLYGEQYLPAVLAFQIIVWDVPLLLFTSFCGNMTTITGEDAAARIYFTAAIANVILNLLLIPKFSLWCGCGYACHRPDGRCPVLLHPRPQTGIAQCRRLHCGCCSQASSWLARCSACVRWAPDYG